MEGYIELKQKAEELLRQAEQARQEEVKGVIAEIREKMAQYNLTVEDLTPRGRRSTGPRGEAVVRYRGPNGEPWSGMGRQPSWLKEAIAQGKTKEDFAVSA